MNSDTTLAKLRARLVERAEFATQVRDWEAKSGGSLWSGLAYWTGAMDGYTLALCALDALSAESDVVGYTYRADLYCPSCILPTLGMRSGPFVESMTNTVERTLGEYMRGLGIDRNDESTFDSSEFPEVVFRDMLMTYQAREGVLFKVRDDCLTGPLDGDPRDRCGSCGEVLGE